jgi:hypothetical protein
MYMAMDFCLTRRRETGTTYACCTFDITMPRVLSECANTSSMPLSCSARDAHAVLLSSVALRNLGLL